MARECARTDQGPGKSSDFGARRTHAVPQAPADIYSYPGGAELFPEEPGGSGQAGNALGGPRSAAQVESDSERGGF